MKARSECPGCGGSSLSPVLRMPRQPAVMNYRFPDPAAARRVPRRDVTLVQCRDCGLVFNATFDEAAVPYDGAYENRQCFSAAFNGHLEALAGGITRRNRLKGGRILEVGCGKGDFLRLLCRTAGATGDGYDTTFEPTGRPEAAGLQFFRHYVGPSEINHPYDAVICRHVVEHVPEIGAFLKTLHGIAVAAGNPVVVLETPRFEWIVEHSCLWDVFHEHCNYFTEAALAQLCRTAGFRVVHQRPVFGGQYQVLELKRSKVAKARVVRRPSPPRLGAFGQRARRTLDRLATRISKAAAGRGWAIWGAGAKGVALVNQLPKCRPRRVIDSNPAKQGGVIPATSVRIVGPDDPSIRRLGLIVIANPNYATEIRADLARIGFSGRILTL